MKSSVKCNALQAIVLGLVAVSCYAPPSRDDYDMSARKKAGTAEQNGANAGNNFPGQSDPAQQQNGESPVPGMENPASNPGEMDPTPGQDPVTGQTPTPGNPQGPAQESQYPNGRGALVPWQEFQAEDGQTNAKVIGPDRTRYDINHIEAEAIGRKAVRLEKAGDFVSIKATKPGNSVLLRLSIPDAPQGGGIDSTIGVYVNGKRHTMNVTSRYSWVYQGEALQTPNNPGDGAHAFFDESAVITDAYQAGAEIKIQRDAQDNAAFYVIDLIDLEQVPAPLAQPADLLSITDFGAKADDDADDGIAIQTAIDKVADMGKKGIWIPKGTFLVRQTDGAGRNLGLSAKGIQIRGAGMWHSRLKGPKASMFCWGEGGCTYSDFQLDLLNDRRDDNTPNNGFNGGLGKGTSVTNVWVEHAKVGMWVGTDADKFGTDGLVVKNSRFRNLYADGINFDNGTINSVAEHNHFRNTGDDAMAIWSYKGAGDRPNNNNVMRFNTVQMPWRANCFAIYGAGNNRIENSVCEDVLTYAGVMVSNDFNAHPFTPTTSIKNMTLIRAGGKMFNQEWGGVVLNTPMGPVNDISFEGIDILDATYSGIEFNGGGQINNVKIKGMNISNAGTFGVFTNNNVQGNVSVEGVVVKGSKKGAYDKQITPESFFSRGAGNEGW